MAKRAIERFDAEASGKLLVGLDPQTAHDGAEAIEIIIQHGQSHNDALERLRDALKTTLQESGN